MDQEINQMVNMMTSMMVLSMTMGMATPVIVPQRSTVEVHPVMIMELARRLREQLIDEADASGTYEELAEDAYMIRKPGIARRLEHIARVERSHQETISDILRELER